MFFKFTAISPLFFLIFSACAPGVSVSKVDSSEAVSPSTNIANFKLLDKDNDGNLDTAVTENGKRVPLLDLDENGVAESVDINGDGTVDYRFTDSNGDGSLDSVVEAENKTDDSEVGVVIDEDDDGIPETPVVGDQKGSICHLPPGNPSNAHTLFVGYPAIKAHLDHGDYEGPCESQPSEDANSDEEDGETDLPQ